MNTVCAIQGIFLDNLWIILVNLAALLFNALVVLPKLID
jgi:hypothetical protein